MSGPATHERAPTSTDGSGGRMEPTPAQIAQSAKVITDAELLAWLVRLQALAQLSLADDERRLVERARFACWLDCRERGDLTLTAARLVLALRSANQ